MRTREGHSHRQAQGWRGCRNRPVLPHLERLEDRTTPVATPLTPQFTVAAVTGAEAAPAAVAIVNASGDFVATWESLETDGSGIGVYAQRFQANGTPIESPVLVNLTTQGNQSRPTIASDGNGHIVLAWQGEAPTGGAYDIYYRTGDVSGGVAWLSASEVVVNAVTTRNQTSPVAAMDANGKFVLAWQSDQDFVTTGVDVYARFGTYSGGLLGTGDVAISVLAGDEKSPEAAMTAVSPDSSGKMLLAWTGPGPSSEEGEATNVIRGTFYSYNGVFDTVAPTDADHTNYQLTAAAQHDQVNPDVAMAPDGKFVLVWQAEGQQGSGSDIFSRRFDANGTGIDLTNALVNTVTAEPQRSPTVGIDSTGDYLVTWQSQGADARSWGIVGRAFQANGAEARADFIVNVNEQGPQTSAGVAVAPNGKTVVIWAGPFVPTHGGTEGEEGIEGEGGHQPALFARLFSASGTADVPPATTALNVNGLEFQLATVGAGEDVPASAVALADGSYVVVWQAFEESLDLSGYGVYGQRVAADGTLIGTKFLINQTTLGYQSHAAVTALPGNGFVVVWQAEVRGTNPTDPSHYDVFARVYRPDGNGGLTAGDEFLVNAPSLLAQSQPKVSSDSFGNFVVVWQTDALAADEYGTEIYARRYSTSGTTATPLGAEFRVNTVTAATTTPMVTGQAQVAAVVAMNAAGQFAVAWVSDHNIGANPEDTEKSIFVRWFDTDGVAPYPEVLANVYTKDAQEHPAIGIDARGDLVVAWQSINQETGGMGVSWGVFARQFQVDSTGKLSPVQAAGEFQVNETTAAPQRFASVGISPSGYFDIAWQTINQDGSSWAVYQRQYTPGGTPQTGEQLVNTVTSGPQILPVFARKADRDLGLFWAGTAADHVDGIAGRIYDWVTPNPDEAFVRELYLDILGREAEAEGLANWLATLYETSREFVAAGIWGSSEHRIMQVNSFYRSILDRDADVLGRTAWVNAMLGGMSEEEVMIGFLSSAEHRAKFANLGGFVAELYDDVLGRTASAAEIDSWLAKTTLTPAELAAGFVFSSEYHKNLIESSYLEYLDRLAAPSEVAEAGWQVVLDSGVWMDTDFLMAVLASPEHYLVS